MFTFYTKSFKILSVDLRIFVLRKVTHYTKVSNPQAPQRVRLAPWESCLPNQIAV